jgi:hypothetical protein
MAKIFPEALPDFHLAPRHVKLLECARRRIKRQANSYVCSAISHGVSHMEEAGLRCGEDKARTAARDLKRFINRAIGGNVFFHDWQMEKGVFVDSDQARKDRIKWIDYLLEHAPRRQTI